MPHRRTQSTCPCLSASASITHTQGEKHMPPQTRADLPCVSRQRGWAGPALFIPDQDIRACCAIGRVHRPARVDESRWSRPPSVFRGSSLRVAARRAGPQDRTPVCGRRFPAPRIARTDSREIARGGDGGGPLEAVDRFLGKLSPRDTTGEQRVRGAVKELMFLPCPSPARSPPTASLPASYFASRGFFFFSR